VVSRARALNAKRIARHLDRITSKLVHAATRDRLKQCALALSDFAAGNRLSNLQIPDPAPVAFYQLVGEAYARVTRSIGAFYTPESVADRLVRLARAATPSLSNRVLDPACGAGSLLLAWLETDPMAELIGWDIDENALLLADRLLSSYADERDLSLDLRLETRDLFDTVDTEPVDVVLMNPPFGTTLTESARRFADRARLAGREPDLFVLSLERVLEAWPNAVAAVILPDVVRMQPEYAELRRSMCNAGILKTVEQLVFGSFPGVTVQPCLVISSPRGSANREVVLLGGDNRKNIEMSELLRDRECRWSLADPRVGHLWSLCAHNGVRLGDIAMCHEGVHTGNIRHKLFAADGDSAAARPMFKGADVHAFHHEYRGRYLRYDAALIDRDAGEYASLRDPEIFRGPKLLSRQTSDRLIVSLDRTDSVTDNSLHTIRVHPEADVAIEWLALYLNSRLATALYRFQSGEQDRPFPQIKLSLLRSLPIPPLGGRLAEVMELYETAKKEAESGGVSAGTIAAIDGIVFDSFRINRSDRACL
jgi:predicted RNA methylase